MKMKAGFSCFLFFRKKLAIFFMTLYNNFCKQVLVLGVKSWWLENARNKKENKTRVAY